MKKSNKRRLTKQMQIDLSRRWQRLAHLVMQAECTMCTHIGRTYIVVRSLVDYPAPGACNMIDVTDEIKSFLWTGEPSANEIISKAINKSGEADKRL